MLRNILSNWFGLLVLGVISAILTPVMVHNLGNVYYGMWVLVGSFVDYSGLLDMGMRSTVFRYVAYSKGANQRSALNEIFATGIAITCSAMCLCALVFVGLAFVLPLFFNFNGADKVTFAWVIILMGLSVSIALPGQFLSAYLRGLERFDLYNLGLISHGMLRGTLLFTLLKMGLSIVPVTTGVFIAAVLFLVVHWLLIKRADRDLNISFAQLNWKRTREMFSFGFYSFVNNSGEVLRNSTDSFVIGRVLGVALITPFSIATRLIEYFRTVTGGISGPVMVRLSELCGTEQEGALREEFLRSTRFCMLISIFVGGLLIFDGRILIRIWIGTSYPLSYPILVILTIAYIVLFGQTPSQLLIFARARYYKALSWLTLAEGAANLVLSILWARKYGLVGVALGTSVPLLVSRLFVQPLYALRDLEFGFAEYFRVGLARPLLAGGGFLACSWLMVRNQGTAASFVHLSLLCVSQGLIFTALSYLVGLTGSDKVKVRFYGQKVAGAFGAGKSA